MPLPPLRRPARGALAAVALLAAAACGGDGPRDEAPRRPNVVLVSIDSLRSDRLSCYGGPRPTSPFLDELAAEGARFERAVSTTSWTLPAHAALFTGLYDSTHGLYDNGQRLSDAHVTLAEHLQRRGWHTAGFFGGPYLHPTFGLGQGFDVYQSCMTTTPDDASGQDVRQGARARIGASHADVTGPRTRAEVERWLDVRPEDRAFFLFLHMWDVHYDFVPPREYVERFDPGYEGAVDGLDFMTDPAVHRGMDPRDLEHLLALYDAEIRFTDDVLRDIFGLLEARGLLEDCLVVVTADHGEEFFEHGGKGHQRTLFDEVLRVPLIVAWPGELAPGRVVADQVRLIDLAPTIAALVGAPWDHPTPGRDLSPLLRGRPLQPAPALAELLVDRRALRALRTEDWKLVRPGEPKDDAFYALGEDPAERVPHGPGGALAVRRAEAARALDVTLQHAYELRALLGAVAESAEADPTVLERLRQLGYIDDEDADDGER